MFQASSAQSSGSTSSSISRSFSSAQSMNSDSRIWPPPFLSILANSASMSSMGPTHWKSYMDVKSVGRIQRCHVKRFYFCSLSPSRGSPSSCPRWTPPCPPSGPRPCPVWQHHYHSTIQYKTVKYSTTAFIWRYFHLSSHGEEEKWMGKIIRVLKFQNWYCDDYDVWRSGKCLVVKAFVDRYLR